MSKNIVINENQAELLGQTLREQQYPIDPEKVLLVKQFLDCNFVKAMMDNIGNDGYPCQLEIVAMKAPNGNILKNMYKEDLLDLLIDKYKNIYLDHDQRRKFLGQVMDDWYHNKIGLYGSLSVNHL